MPQWIGLSFGDGEELDYHGVVAQQDASISRLDRPAPPWALTALVSVLTFGAGVALVGATFGEPIDEGEGSEAASADSESSDSESPPGAELQGQIANAAEAGAEGAVSDSETDVAPADQVADVAEGSAESEVPDEAVLADADPTDSADPADSVEGEGNHTEGEDDTPSTAEAPALPTRAAQGRMQRGRLAYLRCGDLADDAGRCPRDRELELSVWTQLSAVIPRCGVGLGSGDARLRFDGDAPTVTFREFGDTPLDADALTACVTPYVGALRTQLRGSFTFSMRFELE